MNMVRLEHVRKFFRTKQGDVNALDDVSLSVRENEFVVVRGPSGSGKTTLLLSIGGMLRPTEGQILVNGQDIYAQNNRERAHFRAENIGFVFQLFHLVPYLNVVENVLLPSGTGKKQYVRKDAEELLDRLNLSDRMLHRPSQLSAGEKQRTAIARAMLKNPGIILADEPTGNLDPENSREIITHLVKFQKSGGTVIIITHSSNVDSYADRIFYLDKGKIDNRHA